MIPLSPRDVLVDRGVARRRPAAVAARTVRSRRRGSSRVVRSRVAVRGIRVARVRVGRRAAAAGRHRAAAFHARRATVCKAIWSVLSEPPEVLRGRRSAPRRRATAVAFVARRVRLVAGAGAAIVARVVRSARHRVQRRRAAVRVHRGIASTRHRRGHTSARVIRQRHDRRTSRAGSGRVAFRGIRVARTGRDRDGHRRSVRRPVVRRGDGRRVAWHSGSGRVRRVVRVVRGSVERSAVRSRRRSTAAVVGSRRSAVPLVTRRRRRRSAVATLDRSTVIVASTVRRGIAGRRSAAVTIRASTVASTAAARSVGTANGQRSAFTEGDESGRTRQHRGACGRSGRSADPSTAADLLRGGRQRTSSGQTPILW